VSDARPTRFAPLQGIAGFPAWREAEVFEARAALPTGRSSSTTTSPGFYKPFPDQHATQPPACLHGRLAAIAKATVRSVEDL
jgi:hypothetical protein